MKPVHPLVAVLLAAAVAIVLPATAGAVDITKTVPVGPNFRVVHVDVAPPDPDDDGYANNGEDRCPHDGYTGNHGCTPEPVTTPATGDVAPAPAPSTVASSQTGSSNSMVDPSCESGGDPNVYDPSGSYWGKYQFDQQTWNAYAPSGSWGSASEAEQDAAAAAVPYDAWPNC